MEIAKTMGLTPSSIKITNAKTRWGSCSAAGGINYPWRIIQLPDDLSDYVITHEIAHLRELNHSARFWAIVANTMPDHQTRRKRLKELQRQLCKF